MAIRIWHFGVGLVLAAIFAANLVALQDKPKKNKEAKEKAEEEEEEIQIDPTLTNLTTSQREQLSRVNKMFAKLHGLAELPESARQEVRDAIWGTFDGCYQPDRGRVDVLSNSFIEELRAKRISAISAHAIVDRTAELMGSEYLTKDALSAYVIDTRTRLETSQLTRDQSSKILEQLEEMVRTSNRDESKYQRLLDEREQALLKIAAEKQKKIDEEKKKEGRKAKAQQRGSNRSSNKKTNNN
ncbi:MAG: hypothetical protein U1D30_03625 [Planctomycetota bacterium]